MSYILHKKGAFLAFILAFIFIHSLSCSFSNSLSDQDPAYKDDISMVLQDFFKTGDISKIRPLLAEETRIFLSLDKIKSAKGFFSAHQTLLIFKDFFQHNNTVSVQVQSSQEAGSSPFTIKASLIVRDVNAKIKAIDLNITLQKQAGFWKIKEIKETAS
jgi:hypothetical protein